MRGVPKLVAAVSVALVVSSCWARAGEPPGDTATPASPAGLESTTSPSVAAHATRPPATSAATASISNPPAFTEAEVGAIETDVAEIERLVAELEVLLDEPVTP